MDLPHNHGDISNFLQSSLFQSETFDTVADLLKLLSDGKRLQIFWLLCHCEECVINLSAIFNMTSSAVSHHLKLLKTAGLIINRREGKEVYYTAAKTRSTEVLHNMTEEIIEVSCPFDKTFKESHSYDSQIETVNEIHDFMVADLTKRYTIDELAAKFHMNQTTMKTVFKTVFGNSIAAHMKEHRINEAKDLLRHSNKSIAEIAALVGYESQSKFTKAFKELTGSLPKDYRKQHLS